MAEKAAVRANRFDSKSGEDRFTVEQHADTTRFASIVRLAVSITVNRQSLSPSYEFSAEINAVERCCECSLAEQLRASANNAPR